MNEVTGFYKTWLYIPIDSVVLNASFDSFVTKSTRVSNYYQVI